MATNPPVLTDRFFKALELAFDAHRFQVRKAGGKNKSYFGTHLMAVSSYVQEVGGTEDDAIVAILHDTVEDQPERVVAYWVRRHDRQWEGPGTIQQQALGVITDLFGVAVGSGVAELTDDKLPQEWKTMPKEWRQEWIRASVEKKAQKLATESHSVRLVKAADTLHNTRSILQDRIENGPAVWRSFALGAEGTIWKADRMTKVFEEHGPEIIAIELRKVVERIREVAKDDMILKTSK